MGESDSPQRDREHCCTCDARAARLEAASQAIAIDVPPGAPASSTDAVEAAGRFLTSEFNRDNRLGNAFDGFRADELRPPR